MSKARKTTLDLEIGKVYYNRKEPHFGMEVVGIKKKHWYLAKFDGCLSRITPISFVDEETFFDNWFETMDEAESAHLAMLEAEVANFKSFIQDKPEHLKNA